MSPSQPPGRPRFSTAFLLTYHGNSVHALTLECEPGKCMDFEKQPQTGHRFLAVAILVVVTVLAVGGYLAIDALLA